MSWNDVDAVIYDGTADQISCIKCPECDGELKLSYFPRIKSVEIRCKKCGAVVKQNGVSETPNFARTAV